MASVVDIKFVDESENFDFEKSGKSSRPRSVHNDIWSSDHGPRGHGDESKNSGAKLKIDWKRLSWGTGMCSLTS